jgi:hypothetical protein
MVHPMHVEIHYADRAPACLSESLPRIVNMARASAITANKTPGCGGGARIGAEAFAHRPPDMARARPRAERMPLAF